MSGFDHLAGEAGATDLFVFNRVADDRLVNVDGHGRGSGWAGNIAIDVTCEPFLADAVEGGVVRVAVDAPRRLFGPYWSHEAVAVSVDDHVVVVAGEGVADLDEASLRSIAQRATDLVVDVPLAKRLADELEVTQAALKVAQLRPSTVEEAGSRIATIAAEALSCEFGAVLLLEPPGELYVGDRGWRPTATRDEVAAAVHAARGGLEGPLHVEQDLRTSPYAHPPLSHTDGLVARLTAVVGPVDEPLALLTVAHAGTSPRGFTSLCQQVAGGIASAAEHVLKGVVGGTVA